MGTGSSPTSVTKLRAPVRQFAMVNHRSYPFHLTTTTASYYHLNRPKTERHRRRNFRAHVVASRRFGFVAQSGISRSAITPSPSEFRVRLFYYYSPDSIFKKLLCQRLLLHRLPLIPLLPLSLLRRYVQTPTPPRLVLVLPNPSRLHHLPGET